MSQASSVSDSIRRWTSALSHLRARAQRAKRRPGADPDALNALLDEALELCNYVLVDLAGADTEIRKNRDARDEEHQDAMALFERLPVASVSTDSAGIITATNRRAALLLNVSARHLTGKSLLPFSQDRTAFLAMLHTLPRDGSTASGRIAIRPRERRTLSVDAVIVPRTANATEWLWFLFPDGTGDRSADHSPMHGARDVDTEATAWSAES